MTGTQVKELRQPDIVLLAMKCLGNLGTLGKELASAQPMEVPAGGLKRGQE